ncbi:hypothetical protein TRIUR3_14610 [Triticum urartu]|uniref:At1g61320/AtMIF1 LRR domain-containing protein n=2 Tax=Triticum urartu TaxID=4572 RepID=M7YYV9_TRIUA|nr:hypothetical protein TRIUR3_14610 [Triticum urartu]
MARRVKDKRNRGSRRKMDQLIQRFTERTQPAHKTIVPKVVNRNALGHIFQRISGVIYSPYCQCKMLLELPACLMHLNVLGDAIQTLLSTRKHWAWMKDHVERMEIVCNLDGWLQTAITPGIEELTVQLSTKSRKHYNFPWSLLANENGKLIQYLKLSCCAFSPTVGLCLKSLSRLELFDVNITRDQMGSLLHNFFALQRMQLKNCNNITCLKIPFNLQQLKYLEVFHCSSLQVIEIEAPILSNFGFMGLRQVQLSLGVALQFKKFDMSFPGVVSYACTNLLSNLQYVEALSLCSRREIIDTPVLPSKFLHLKHLSVDLNAMTFSPTYDYYSLISLFDASPSLETLVLNVLQRKMLHESIVRDTSNLRQIPGHRHDRLKTVKIIGFSSAKSVVELTCHVIENTTSLKCLTLDTTTRHPWHSCLTNYSGKCLQLRADFLVEVGKGLLAIRTYVEPKVPFGVELNVVEPCRRCHDLEPLS